MSATIRPDSAQFQRVAWAGILTAATVVATFTLDCATPFAALATLAALFLPRRDAFALIGVNWAVNQFIGLAILHWPMTPGLFAGGAELGLACMLCTAMAMSARSLLRPAGWVPSVAGAFVTAFISFQGVFMIANLVQPHGEYDASVMLYIFYINGVAFAGLLLLQSMAMSVGLAVPRAHVTGRVLAAA